MALEAVADRLSAALGPHKVITDPNRLAGYRGIAWGAAASRNDLAWPVGPPAAVAVPASTDDVVAVIGVARETRTPVVPYGAGTGVHAGAAPLQGSIVVDVGAMNQVMAISRTDRSARVQPGVLLGALDRISAEHGLMMGHDPWSQPIASVGGAVSTNGVGYLAGKYGSMGEQVLGLEVVLGTGQIVRVRALPKTSTGPQMRHFFIGAEGVLGVITEVTLRLYPIPERRSVAGYWFPRFEDGLAAVLDMVAIQLRPSMIDYEEDSSREQAVLGLLVDVPSAMYLAFEGFREEVAAQTVRADAICRAHLATPMSREAPRKFWDTRHEASDRWVEQRKRGEVASAQWTTASLPNVSLPVSAIQEFRERAARELAPYRLAIQASGLWGMPELFSVRFVHVAPGDPQAADELDAGTDAGLRLVQELGGSMEYCHGVGLTLAHLMPNEWGVGLEALRRVKGALDPDHILNPGKLGL
ncbi:MAG: FAD-binding oxidoreductase [Chloroflexi bacterium]|nr:FAD-binding oxidoreductase [Chloroflexota bacterium]